ncbi:MAG: STAS domain-containing protein [Streptosporangiaceae bacterium]|nr:STAS domain-containing protein [Streptosporangiaceae bacterium]MBV9858224.1 STAS domain-containing protein [Streptosporangiaceae bacterium]
MTYVSYPDTLIKGVAVVETPAEIDITTADQLRAALLYAISNRHPLVVVDMTSTRFCDSAGLHALIAAYKRAHAEDGELRLVIPADGALPRVLTLTGIDHFLPCFASLEDALGPV